MKMTIKEAVTVLNCVEAHGVCIKAKEMAIKSLEAWEKVRAEIEELPSGLAYYIKGTSVLPAVEKGSLRELIDEHLRRIAE